MTTYIPDTLRQTVIERAKERCEYCLLHQRDEPAYTHEIDHIVAEKHLGQTIESNLAYACFYCNRFKGSDLTSIDPLTSNVTRLFNPREDIWADHFLLDGSIIVPLTDIARTTIRLLRMNRIRIIERRTYLIQLGRYP